ncbi:MAG: hypothetical protein WD533_02785 [Dehalococcoidia bacterium]
MTAEAESLQGWIPEIGEGTSLDRVIDLAFDYRGDVTVDIADGGELTGFLYNRERKGPQPFIQMFETASGDPVTLPYDRITNIRFTGRDPAAGQSYEAWKARREALGKTENKN